MRVVSGPADVKVGDLVEFDPDPTKERGRGRANVRGTVSAVRDASITVRSDDGKISIVRYQVTRKTRDRFNVYATEVNPIVVIEPRDLWLQKRPACVGRFDLRLDVAIGFMPRATRADAFAAIAREVEAWLREEPEA